MSRELTKYWNIEITGLGNCRDKENIKLKELIIINMMQATPKQLHQKNIKYCTMERKKESRIHNANKRYKQKCIYRKWHLWSINYRHRGCRFLLNIKCKINIIIDYTVQRHATNRYVSATWLLNFLHSRYYQHDKQSEKIKWKERIQESLIIIN